MRECHCHILLSSLERDFSLQISTAVSRPRRGFQPSAGQSVSQAVPPRSPHHRLKGRLRSPRSTQVQSTRVVRVWVWSLKVARKSRSGIGNGIGNILESLSTLSRLVSRSRERTFLCTSDPIHMRCGRLLHTADVCSRTQTTTDKPPRPEVPPHPFHSWSKVVTAGSSLSTAGSGKALFGPSRRCRSAIRSARW